MSERCRNNFMLELDSDPVHTTLSGLWNAKEQRHYVRDILPDMFDHALEHILEYTSNDDLFRERMDELQKTLKLSAEEIDIFLCSLAVGQHLLWAPRQNRRGGSFSSNIFMMSKCLNMPEEAIMHIVTPKSPLRRFQCLDDDLDVDECLFPFLCGLTDEPLANSFFTKDTEAVLPWSNFANLTKQHGSILKRMLSSNDKPKKPEVPRLVEQLMMPHCELLEVKLADDKLLPSKDYSLEGLNIQGDVQLERIVEAVRGFMNQNGKLDVDRPRMNLLLSGAPGTGKTEFIKYLGNILKTKVNVKMGSDLLSRWVGGTEQNIADAFRQGEAEHSILFLDEIDGLVQSRTNAQHSWEVTQVNELLHQMENFNGVMIGATNIIQNLDQAIMRRFTFKLQFNYLDNNGKRLFFQRMFKTTLTEDELQRLNAISNLAPGDFRTVRQSLFYYGGDITNSQRLEALECEAEVKNCGAFISRKRIGF